jgi:hypothetical protein
MNLVRVKGAGDCSKSLSMAGGGRHAASLLSTDMVVAVYEEAVWLKFKLNKLHGSEAYELL